MVFVGCHVQIETSNGFFHVIHNVLESVVYAAVKTLTFVGGHNAEGYRHHVRGVLNHLAHRLPAFLKANLVALAEAKQLCCAGHIQRRHGRLS